MDLLKKARCPELEVSGIIENGSEYDLDITLSDDPRDVIYGVVKDYYREPVENAVVKLLEIDVKSEKPKRKPVTHTFTNKDGEFVFGPLCPDKKYAIEIWVNAVKHVKLCANCNNEGPCLEGVSLDTCDCNIECDKPKTNSKCEEKSCKC